MIYQVEDYYDDKNRHVREFVVVSGEKPEEFARFVGVGMIEVQLGPQRIPRQFNARLNVDSLEEAFENFDAEMQVASEEAKKEIEKEMQELANRQRQEEMSRIVVPE